MKQKTNNSTDRNTKEVRQEVRYLTRTANEGLDSLNETCIERRSEHDAKKCFWVEGRGRQCQSHKGQDVMHFVAPRDLWRDIRWDQGHYGNAD
mgnify:CR=1 FL=1